MTKKINLANDVETFLEEIEEREGKPLYEMTPEEAREFLLSVQRKNYINIKAEVTDKTISSSTAENIDIRIIKPEAKTEKLPAVIYAHGGGWVMGDKEAYDMLIKRIANEAECCVIFVNYKKSPEYTYPTALNEICGVLEYITKYPDEYKQLWKEIKSSRFHVLMDPRVRLINKLVMACSYLGINVLKILFNMKNS